MKITDMMQNMTITKFSANRQPINNMVCIERYPVGNCPLSETPASKDAHRLITLALSAKFCPTRAKTHFKVVRKCETGWVGRVRE